MKNPVIQCRYQIFEPTYHGHLDWESTRSEAIVNAGLQAKGLSKEGDPRAANVRIWDHMAHRRSANLFDLHGKRIGSRP